ncbi:unnamed protein product [Mortierella alpina]
MEILKVDAAMLSNYEVMTLLNDQKAQRQANEVAGTRETAENLRTVEFEVQNGSATILNLRPKSPVELLLLIEEFEERFKLQDCEDMLRIITECMPRDDDEVMDDDDEDVMDDAA